MALIEEFGEYQERFALRVVTITEDVVVVGVVDVVFVFVFVGVVFKGHCYGFYYAWYVAVI